MTRQEKITKIGASKPSLFYIDEDKKNSIKNHVSCFIIPVAHNLYEYNNPKKLVDDFKNEGWKLLNPVKDGEKRIFADNDPLNMASFKPYIYTYMNPVISDDSKDFEKIFNTYPTLLFEFAANSEKSQKSSWKLFDRYTQLTFNFSLENIHLWIFNNNIAFFSLMTRLNSDDSATVSDISGSYNRTFRDYRELRVDKNNNIFTNEPNTNFPLLLDFLLGELPEPKLNLSPSDMKSNEYNMIDNTSYYAKMITAIHIDETAFDGEPIEASYVKELIDFEIKGTSILEEIPFHLGSTGALYPSSKWENNVSIIQMGEQ